MSQNHKKMNKFPVSSSDLQDTAMRRESRFQELTGRKNGRWCEG